MLGKEKLNTYRPTIDPEYSEDGQELGINLISNVKTPAVKVRGVAYSNHESKELRFKDNLKLRIAGPVLIPSHIYRNDEDEEYYMEFTEEDIEIIAKDFMSRLSTKEDGIFNLEHGTQMVDSYILEAILVDSETKVRMIKTDYGIDVPIGTFFIVQQFTDKKVYDDIIKRDAIGFSFEGFMGTILVNNYKFKNDEMKNLKLSKMKSPKKLMGTKRTFKSASKKMKFEEVIEGEIILIAEDFEEGKDIVVIEDVTEGAVEDFKGEVDVTVDGKEEVLIIEDGVITEVVEGESVEDAEKEEAVIADEGEVKEEEMAEEEEEVKEEVKEEEMEEVSVDAPEAADVTAELEEIYKVLADIKAELAELKTETPTEDEVIDEVMLREQKYSNALTAFNKFSNRK